MKKRQGNHSLTVFLDCCYAETGGRIAPRRAETAAGAGLISILRPALTARCGQQTLAGAAAAASFIYALAIRAAPTHRTISSSSTLRLHFLPIFHNLRGEHS